jgi:putative PIN family toxin of toxin-antitoxin system
VRAAIDTSAWVSVVLSRQGPGAQRRRGRPILDALASGRLTLVASETTFAEMTEVLERPELIRTGEARRLARTLMATIRDRAEFVAISGELHVCRDPNDDPLIETALEGRADVLVREDKDLTDDPDVAAVLASGGVRVLRLAAFLAELEGSEE